MGQALEAAHISWDLCPDCASTGYRVGESTPCGTCKGQGRVKPAGWKNPDPVGRTCPTCKGSGQLPPKGQAPDPPAA